MNQEAITKASEIINARTDFIGNGMEGYATVTLIDEDGYPSSTTMTISKADGIKWQTFLSGLSSNPTKRITKCNKACVCLSSEKYHISLVGTMEVLTDDESKKANWQTPMEEYWSGPEEPEYCVLRFTAERYNLYIVDGELEAKGTL
jgi:general stress protein 26